MSEFKVIETQEDFDKAIQKRLAQKDRELAETYKEYLSPEKVKDLKDSYESKIADIKKSLDAATEKITKNDQIVSDLTKRAQTAETSLLKTKIAHEKGLPLELAGRLVGSTEEELTADAETLSGIIKPSHSAPLHTGEVKGGQSGTPNQAMLGLLSSLNEQMTN